MPIGPARMPLLEHLGELRMRLTRIVVVLLVATCVFYFATPTVMQIMTWPIQDVLEAYGIEALAVLDPFEGFGVRFLVSIWTGVVATMPVIIWQLLAFFLPALKPKERKWFIPTFIAAVCLFMAGTIFCYTLILNPAFQWLMDQAGEFATVMARAETYIDIIIKFELGFGLAFELPLIVFYLVIFNIVPYKKLRGAWRGVYVGLLVLSAMVTPDASPVTMGLMFAAMVVLYEFSLLLARVVLRKRIKKQEEEDDEDSAELLKQSMETEPKGGLFAKKKSE
jgi:sec-independent protein translocase protein TatC